jgi:hypothetical protein
LKRQNQLGPSELWGLSPMYSLVLGKDRFSKYPVYVINIYITSLLTYLEFIFMLKIHAF